MTSEYPFPEEVTAKMWAYLEELSNEPGAPTVTELILLKPGTAKGIVVRYEKDLFRKEA